MFWNDPEHCLESIILIEGEDDILSIPRQRQVYCICLGLSQANKPVSCLLFLIFRPEAEDVCLGLVNETGNQFF
jgi:hypothetical protein